MTVSNLLACYPVLIFFIFLATGCDDDTAVTTSEGRFFVEITDAPVDDPNVSAVFITVADVKVDGQSVEGFSKTTIELSSLQNGVTEMLVAAALEAKAYNNVEIVLDDATDAAGNSPGCYAMTNDNEKVALDVAGDGALSVNNSGFNLTQGATIAAVIDFDCVRPSNGPTIPHSLMLLPPKAVSKAVFALLKRSKPVPSLAPQPIPLGKTMK
ncbi:MAG: hypothetical protein ACI81P_003221 [Neolewinella sp.]|jgi:hypothetical protein